MKTEFDNEEEVRRAEKASDWMLSVIKTIKRDAQEFRLKVKEANWNK